MKKFWMIILPFLLLGLTGCESVQKRANTQDTWSKIEKRSK